jgi:hypothetical protein
MSPIETAPLFDQPAEVEVAQVNPFLLISDCLDQLAAHPDKKRLEQLSALEWLLGKAQRKAVANLRAQGMTWAEVGDVFGITRQAAQQRFGK